MVARPLTKTFEMVVRKMNIGGPNRYWRTEQGVSPRPRPNASRRLNDVFSIHFNVAILIAGKFRRTVDVAHGKDARRGNRCNICWARTCTYEWPGSDGLIVDTTIAVIIGVMSEKFALVSQSVQDLINIARQGTEKGEEKTRKG